MGAGTKYDKELNKDKYSVKTPAFYDANVDEWLMGAANAIQTEGGLFIFQKGTDAGRAKVDAEVSVAIPAGANVVGKVGIDQTTPGTTNKVVAGIDQTTPGTTNKVVAGIDQTTPGTTNKVVAGIDQTTPGTTNKVVAELSGSIAEYGWIKGKAQPAPIEDIAIGIEFDTVTKAKTSYVWDSDTSTWEVC